jgi:hypothetical protein
MSHKERRRKMNEQMAQKLTLWTYLKSLVQSLLRRTLKLVEALQEHDEPESFHKIAILPIHYINKPSPSGGRQGDKWRQYTPSRFVKWLVQNTGPNRKQRREEARTYRKHLRHIAQRQYRLEEQRARKQLRMA